MKRFRNDYDVAQILAECSVRLHQCDDIDLTTLTDDLLSIIQETGEGIPAEDLPHIWERFYQTESTRTRLDRGTGLGVALVKEWIEVMGGTIVVKSIVGEGSWFTIRLPRMCAV